MMSLAAARCVGALAASLAAAACSDSTPKPPASAQRAVLPAELQADVTTLGEMVGELGIQVGPGVSAEDAESLQVLMEDSGFHIKAIELLAPGRYRLKVWGPIPHAASEFTIERRGEEWEMVGDTPWVLIAGAGFEDEQ